MHQNTPRTYNALAIAVMLVIGSTIMLFATQTAHAQPGSGSIYVAGVFTFAYESETIEGSGFADVDQDIIRFGLHPSVGYHVTDNIVVGAGVGYEYTRIEDQLHNADADHGIYSVSPFVRYTEYLSANWRWFGEAVVTYGQGEGESRLTGGGVVDTEIEIFQAGVRPGFIYELSESLAIEPSFGFIGFRGESVTKQEEFTNSSITIQEERGEFVIDYDFSLGVHFYF